MLAFLLSTLLASSMCADVAAFQAPKPDVRAPADERTQQSTDSTAVGPIEPTALASLEDEVLRNIREQPLGPATVDDLALPEPFLRRFADRIIRTSYEQNFRIVVADGEDPAPDGADASPATAVVPTTSAAPSPSNGAPKESGEEFGATLWKRAIVGVLVLAALIWVFARTKKSA